MDGSQGHVGRCPQVLQNLYIGSRRGNTNFNAGWKHTQAYVACTCVYMHVIPYNSLGALLRGGTECVALPMIVGAWSMAVAVSEY